MADLTSHEAPAHEAHALPVMTHGKLIGRDVVLARVYSHLKESKPVLVYGASGIGKTALAATLASAYTELPGGVLWLEVNDTSFPDLLARIGRAFNIRELATTDNPLSMVGAIMSALLSAKPMIVLDGKINAQACSEFIMRCTDRLPILLINDEDASGPWTSIPLGILEADAATSLFRNLAPDNTDGIESLITALDGIPFALTAAAGAIRAQKSSPSAFLTNLPKRADVSPSLLTLTASFGTLPNPLQGLLLLMGATFRGEASGELFSIIANAPEDSVTQGLSRLVQQNLVERFTRYGKPYYRLHPITHTFAQTWLRGSNRLEGLQAKVRDAVLSYVRKYSGDHDRLAAEMENFLAVARWAAETKDRDVANQIALALMQAGDFVKARGYVYELLLLNRLAASSTTAFPAYNSATAPANALETIPFDEDDLEPSDELDDYDEFEEIDAVEDELDEDVDDADFVDDASDEEDDLDEDEESDSEALEPLPIDMDDELDEDDEDEDDLGISFSGEDDSEPIPEPLLTDEVAKLKASLVHEKLGGNRRRQAEILSELGRMQVARGLNNEAITTYTEAVGVYEALNNQPGLLTALEALAALMTKTENAQAAVMHASRGAKLAETLGNESLQRSLLTVLGDARQQLGESDSAIAAYAEALDLARAGTDAQSEALILYKLGFAQLDSGDVASATQSWEDALTQFRELDRRDYEGRTLAALGTAAGEQEHWTEAIKFYTSALYIAREMKDREEEMLRLNDMGYASVQAHQLGQAVLRYRQALHLAYVAGVRENIVSTTVDLARLLVESQRHLNITEMLVNGALEVDPNDRDLKRLIERIEDERAVLPEGIQLAQVAGTAQDYAANAYAMLDNA
jgi:tetratricopeptide (TPR) repeat protein/energy-coupling factor transporter ATP-binding protein EcfA2